MADRLREAYRRAMAGEGEHVADATWERLAANELSAEQRRAVSDHVASCAECAAVYRALTALAAEAHTFDAHAPSPSRASGTVLRWRPRRALAVAAAVAATAAAVLILRPFFTGGPSVPSEVRSAVAEAGPRPIEPVGDVDPEGITFRWAGPEDATGYVVEVLDEQGEPFWRSPETPITTVGWPEGVTAEEGRYYWRVTARLEHGDRSRSELAAFTVISGSPR